MGKLRDGFIDWYKTGVPKEPLMFRVIADLIDSYFLSVRKVRSNYFENFGFTAEGTFIEEFEDQFILDKLDDYGLSLLARQPDDDSIKRTINFLIKQYYNTKFMAESKKHARYALDTIIEKLEKARIIKTQTTNNKRDSKSITLIKQTDLSECEKYFTKNFLNVDAKVLSLQTVINELEKREKAWYYELIDDIAGYFEKYDNTTGIFEKPDEEESEIEDDAFNITASPRYAAPDDEPSDEEDDAENDLLNSELENSSFSHSISLDFEPIGSDQKVILVTDLKVVKKLIDEDEEEITEDVQLLIGLLLKRLNPNEFNAFILTFLCGGYSNKAIPLEIKNRIIEILQVSQATYYNCLIGFNQVMDKIKKDDRYGFDDNDVLAAIDQLSEVYRRNFVI